MRRCHRPNNTCSMDAVDNLSSVLQLGFFKYRCYDVSTNAKHFKIPFFLHYLHTGVICHIWVCCVGGLFVRNKIKSWERKRGVGSVTSSDERMNSSLTQERSELAWWADASAGDLERPHLVNPVTPAKLPTVARHLWW